MRVMAMGAGALVALLMSAGPVAAQKGVNTTPDNNAICLIGVTYMASLASQHKDQLSKEAQDAIPAFDKAIYFHAGVLRGRYADADLDAVIDTGATAFFKTKSDDRPGLIMTCLQESGPMLKRVADVLSKN